MTRSTHSPFFKCPLLTLFVASAFLAVALSQDQPTFTQCRAHIEAAMKGMPIDESAPLESPSLLDDHPVEEVLPEPDLPPADSVEPIVEEEPAPEEAVEIVEETVVDEQQEEDGDDSAEQDVEQDQEVEETADELPDDASADEQDDGDVDEANGEQDDQSEVEEAAEMIELEPAVEEVSVVEEVPAPEALEAPAEAEEAPAEPEPAPVVEEPTVEAEPEPEPEPVPVIEEPVATSEPEPIPELAVVEPVAVAQPEEPAAAPVAAEEPAPPAVQVDDPAEGIIEEAPAERRSRDHIAKILRLDGDVENDMMRESIVHGILKDVKRLVETSVRSLENIFKYNDVSNRQFGDPEIFSKPLVLFIGPWSGGKSSIINYLLDTEFTKNALKTGAEPSATFFQILMHGDREEMLDGTQLAADWTFSGLQKFGQAFIDRLRGRRLPSRILEKVNIVEVPGILEVRKQVDRPYPFNDVVQWFIDRADIIFVVYDPTKLDTGLEHEALFDQLKGRQNQVRVLLNKADSVTQEELLLIQNNLVWNLSPLMASPLPPTLYAGSFWSAQYKPDAPVRLLRAHEENMLNDLREAMENVVENTIAEARRHAVRVRNHAKMVDCYLTTFFNQKGFFGNKKAVADDIIENPHAYHIFEGLSTLSNISRYDLPDAEVYKDFFRLHPLYDFKPLASTCTFFRGCPLDKLDTAIAYELPELIGKYKKRLQSLSTSNKKGAKKSSH